MSIGVTLGTGGGQEWWPTVEALGACEREVSMADFVGWLIEIGETGDLSRVGLEALHVEYCCHEGVRPLSPRALVNACKMHGITKARPSVYVPQPDGTTKEIKRTVYRVTPVALFRHDMRKAA